MAKATYVVTKDFKSPYVISTNLPHAPTQIKFKKFRKGDIINGELKHANNVPAFVLYSGTVVVPLSVIKAVVTKEIISSATGQEKADNANKQVIVETNSKIKYLDAAIIGALVGIGAVYLAEKKGWIKIPTKENKFYGAGIGALAGGYFMYRTKNSSKVKITK